MVFMGLFLLQTALNFSYCCFGKEKGATFSRNPLISLCFWLLDLGSNQGPTD